MGESREGRKFDLPGGRGREGGGAAAERQGAEIAPLSREIPTAFSFRSVPASPLPPF